MSDYKQQSNEMEKPLLGSKLDPVTLYNEQINNIRALSKLNTDIERKIKSAKNLYNEPSEWNIDDEIKKAKEYMMIVNQKTSQLYNAKDQKALSKKIEDSQKQYKQILSKFDELVKESIEIKSNLKRQSSLRKINSQDALPDNSPNQQDFNQKQIQKLDQKAYDKAQYEQLILDERSKELEKLAQMININLEVMKDQALMVNEQGVKIDQIQDHIQSTHVKVEAGVKELTKTQNYNKKSQKNYCYFAIIIILAVGTVLAIVLAQ